MKEKKKERVLITGLCGFVGHHVVEHFLKNTDMDIVGLDKLSYSSDGMNRLRDIDAFDEDRVKVFTTNLGDENPFQPGLIKELGEIDYVIHIAAESHVDNSLKDAREFARSNVLGTTNLLEYLKKYQPNLKKYIGFNTDEVFGPAPEGTYSKETDKFYPSNPYSGAKAGQWAMEWSFAHAFEMPICITHTMNIIGERQHPEKFLPMTIRKILNGEKVILHGVKDKMSSRKWIHARNVADALEFLLEKGEREESYNIAGEEADVLQVANMVCNVIKGRDLREDEYEIHDVHSQRPGHDLRYSLDGSKMKKMGWDEPVGLEETIRNIVKWSTTRPDWLKI